MMIAEPQRETLVARLRERGIRYLAPGDARADDQTTLAPSELIRQLAASDDARLRLSLIALFILQPELAQDVPHIVDTLAEPARDEAIAGYMAAVYLQRMWSVRLQLYLPDMAVLPDWFSIQLGLPSPDERFGKVGLHALAEWHTARSLFPFNWRASYQRVMDQLFEQLKQEAHQRERASTG